MIRAALFTLAAAVASTVLCAWILACLPGPVGTWPLEPEQWPGETPPHWPRGGEGAGVMRSDGRLRLFDYSAEQRGFGRVESQYNASSWDIGEDGEAGKFSRFLLFAFERRAAGWPMLALCTDALEETVHGAQGGGGVTTAMNDTWLWRGVPFPPARPIAKREVRLPIRVLWTGFAFNTGAVWAPLFFVVVLVRFIKGRRASGRVRQGLCERCGYELAGARICPECGGGAGLIKDG